MNNETRNTANAFKVERPVSEDLTAPHVEIENILPFATKYEEHSSSNIEDSHFPYDFEESLW